LQPIRVSQAAAFDPLRFASKPLEANMARDPKTSKERPNSSGRGPENPSQVGSNARPVNPSVTGPNELQSTNRGDDRDIHTPSMSTNPNPNIERGTGMMNNEMMFRCADVGHDQCNWSVRGQNEDELMPQIEQHGREHHNLREMDEGTRSKVRGAIRKAA
jgi:predicted small metal-binding protein